MILSSASREIAEEAVAASTVVDAPEEQNTVAFVEETAAGSPLTHRGSLRAQARSLKRQSTVFGKFT